MLRAVSILTPQVVALLPGPAWATATVIIGRESKLPERLRRERGRAACGRSVRRPQRCASIA